MTREDLDTDTSASFDTLEALFKAIEASTLQPVTVEGRNATEISAGVNAIKPTIVDGAKVRTYPPGAFWHDLDATNLDAFEIVAAGDTRLIRPKRAGLYRVDFYTTLRATTAVSLQFWLYQYPGNRQLAYTSFSLTPNQSVPFSLTRYVRMTGAESVYLAVHQTVDEGKVVLWAGDYDEVRARAYSGLYLTKV